MVCFSDLLWNMDGHIWPMDTWMMDDVFQIFRLEFSIVQLSSMWLHSFTMEIHWLTPAAMVEILVENPGIFHRDSIETWES